MADQTLSRNPNWKGGRTVTADGYVLLKRPDHRDADVRGYVYEHRLVAEQKLSRPLLPGEEVHHRTKIQHCEEWTLYMNALTGFRATSMQSGMDGPRVDWVIVGGESGPGARPLHTEWARSIVAQCRAAGTPVLVKQLGREVLDDGMSSPGQHWPMTTVRNHRPRRTDADAPFYIRLHDRKGGDPAEWPEDLRVREFPETA